MSLLKIDKLISTNTLIQFYTTYHAFHGESSHQSLCTVEMQRQVAQLLLKDRFVWGEDKQYNRQSKGFEKAKQAIEIIVILRKRWKIIQVAWIVRPYGHVLFDTMEMCSRKPIFGYDFDSVADFTKLVFQI
jgi:hypothetical protein